MVVDWAVETAVGMVYAMAVLRVGGKDAYSAAMRVGVSAVLTAGAWVVSTVVV